MAVAHKPGLSVPRRFSLTQALRGIPTHRMVCPTEISSEEDTRSGDLAVGWWSFILPAEDVTATDEELLGRIGLTRE